MTGTKNWNNYLPVTVKHLLSECWLWNVDLNQFILQGLFHVSVSSLVKMKEMKEKGSVHQNLTTRLRSGRIFCAAFVWLFISLRFFSDASDMLPGCKWGVRYSGATAALCEAESTFNRPVIHTADQVWWWKLMLSPYAQTVTSHTFLHKSALSWPPHTHTYTHRYPCTSTFVRTFVDTHTDTHTHLSREMQGREADTRISMFMCPSQTLVGITTWKMRNRGFPLQISSQTQEELPLRRVPETDANRKQKEPLICTTPSLQTKST